MNDRLPQILERVTIAEILAERGHEPARRGSLSDKYRCPLPGHEDSDPSFAIRAGRWKCWSQCDRGGDVVDLVVLLDGVTKAEAIDKLAARCGLGRLVVETAPKSTLSPERAARLLDRFLEGRCWDAQAAAEMGLHVVLDERLRPRVRFSYFYGEEVAWHQDRALGEGRPKWLSPRGKRPAMFNANSLRLPKERDGELWLVEGPSDVMALVSTHESPAVVGIPGAGNFSAAWVPAFAGLRQVVVIGDNDPAGMKFRARCRELLSPVVGHVVDLHVPQPHNDLDAWRQSFGPDGSERFGEALQRAAEAAEKAAAA